MMIQTVVQRHIRIIAAVLLCSALVLTSTASFTLQAQTTGEVSGLSSSFNNATDRLMNRLGRMNTDVNELRAAASAEERIHLLNHEIRVLFAVAEGLPAHPGYRLRMTEHPGWIVFNSENSAFEIDEYAVRMFLEERQSEMLSLAAHAVAQNPTERWVERYDVIGNPREGYRLDSIESARQLVHALEQRATEVVLPVVYESPALFVRSASGTVQLERLSRGISNFKGSAWGRKANVVKALESQLRGMIIHPGESFSFEKAMAGAGGWSNAYVIANGGELVMEPGGGICQAATTAFRAAVLAGLPIDRRANHSLYVTYYRAYGVGIDATYYPGKQDFTFRNDTAHPIVIVAYAEGDEAIVELYGVPDGRTVAVYGPYFAGKQDELADSRKLSMRSNQIGWLYDVTYPDGNVKQDALVSTYKAIPKKLRDEYEALPGIDELLGRTGTGGTKVMNEE